MRRDADRILQEWLTDEANRQRYCLEYKVPDDRRITKVGTWLRRSSLDELPQLINVIRGEMSLVGCRPIVRDELEHYGHDSPVLLSMRPGLTGIWQAGRRNEAHYPERAHLELGYVRSSCLLLDLGILARTFLVPLRFNGR
jgi:lipopolysaccharide/colanic/teichoic acid biosynthesis glycosyltransferase